MVATRNSLPSQAASNSPETPTGELTKAQKALMKKLNINANPSLIVGKTSQTADARNTYHWRGSVYEVTGKEPEEWLQQQPERYKKRQSAGAEGRVVEDGEAVGGVEKTGRRTQSFVVDGADDERSLNASGKRKRSSELNGEEDERPTTKRKQAANTDGANDDRPTKKTKKNAPKSAAYKQIVEADEEEEEDADPMYSSRVFDFTRVGGQEPMSCSEARALARQRGFITEPLPQSVIDRGRGLKAAEKVINLALLNKKIVRLGQEYIALRTQLEGLKGSPHKLASAPSPQTSPQRSESAPPKTGNLQRNIAGGHSTPVSIDPNAMSSPDVIITRVSRRSTPPAALASPFDSAKPLTESTPQKLYQPHKPRDRSAIPDLPTTTRDGRPLRWSLDVEKLKLMGSGDGRAEDAISFGRLEGESKAAKRRRVQRELNLVRSWQRVDRVDREGGE